MGCRHHGTDNNQTDRQSGGPERGIASHEGIGRQFVLGRDIGEAIKRSQDKESKGYTHSYDMLGKTAHIDHDAGVTASLFGTIDQVSVSDIKNAPDLAGVFLEQGAVDHHNVRMALASRNGPILPLIKNLVDWRGPC